jgi:hypothetical protein
MALGEFIGLKIRFEGTNKECLIIFWESKWCNNGIKISYLWDNLFIIYGDKIDIFLET